MTWLVDKTKNLTEISDQRVTILQKYKKTCVAVLKVISHNGIKIFVPLAFQSLLGSFQDLFNESVGYL